MLLLLSSLNTQAQDSIRKFENGRRLESSQGLAIERLDDKENTVRLTRLLAEAQSASTLEMARDRLAAATSLCRSAGLPDWHQKIQTTRRLIYREAFQRKLRHLRSADWTYSRQLSELAELKTLIEEGDLGAAHKQKYTELEGIIHETEVHRLVDMQVDFESYMQLLNQATQINEEHLGQSQSPFIEAARLAAVDEAIEEVLNSRGGSFNRQLKQVETAYDYTAYLSDAQRPARENQLRQYRREMVRDELKERRRALALTQDWRATLAGYEALLQFAQRFSEDLDRRIIRNLRQDRQAFLADEYEIRIQRSLRQLQMNDLEGAQLALAGAVELTQTNLLPAGPAGYRHRELYQTLYEAQRERLQEHKSVGDWSGAEATIQRLESLFVDAPFILARASIREERQWLEVARWEYFLAEASQQMSVVSQEEQYQYAYQLMDGYLELHRLIGQHTERELIRLLQRLGDQSLEKAKRSGEEGQYQRALAALYDWHRFLYMGRNAAVLPARMYSEQNAVWEYLIKAQQRSLIQRMEEETVDLTGVLQQRRRFELDRRQRRQVDAMEAELRFVAVYERGKTALRKNHFPQAMTDFDQAAQQSAQLSPGGQYTSATLEKQSLIENGRRLALEGMLLEQIQGDAILGASAQKNAYRSLWRLRRSYQEIPLTENAERSIQDLEYNWFGGACRKEYRAYTLQLLDAEDAIERADYGAVVSALRRAEKLQYDVEPCMLPIEDLSGKIHYYELALDFNQQKANLSKLYQAGDWEALEQDYAALWADYIRFEIREKFGYQMIPFSNYVLESAEPALMKYFVLRYCTEGEDREAVVESIRQLSHFQSKEEMQELGAKLAYRIYAFLPERKYKSSFRLLEPKGGLNQRTFRKLKKGYRKAWRKMR